MRDEGYPRKGKAMRKGKVSLGIIVTFFVGVIVGLGIAVLAGAILYYIEPDTLLTECPKTFGDIKVWAFEPTDLEEDEDVDKSLVMAKDDIPFLYIFQNEAGEISSFHLSSGPQKSVFHMTPQSTPGKWGQARYSKGNGTGHLVGNGFTDIDFDGQFDFKFVLDDNGKRISRSIFIDGVWQKIDRCNTDDMIAVSGQTKYIFEPNSGWVIHE